MIFRNRQEAGNNLVKRLQQLTLADPLVLALPRGGVPVAEPIARALNAPLSVLVVRKIGATKNREVGIGAVIEDEQQWIDERLVKLTGSEEKDVQDTLWLERDEVERRVKAYRNGRPLPSVSGREIVLVDDGLATGVTARLAISYLKKLAAKRIVFACPVCSKRTGELLKEDGAEVVCGVSPAKFVSVSEFYDDFEPVHDEEVISILAKWEGIERASA